MDTLLDTMGLRPPPWETVLQMFAALGFAALLGGVIGFDRQQRGRAAGLRTHAMVAVGAAVYTLVAIEGSDDAQSRMSEIVKGIAAGIGFLGSGAILKNHDGIEGLTTASTIWLSAAIGLATGAGAVWLAAMTTGICLLLLKAFRPGEQ